LLAAAGCGLTLAVWASCAASPQHRYEQRVVATGEPALHAVHAQRIEQLMNEIDRMMIDPLIDLSHTSTVDRARARRDIGRVAGELADASTHITESLPPGELDDTEEKLFRSLADKLREEALELQGHAEAKRDNEIAVSMDEITAVCNACHSAFRMAPDPVQ
jgi:hypothetical protein